LPYLQDTDFCFKLQLASVPLHFVPNAVIHVRLRHTLRGTYNQARRWAVYRVKVYKKYQGTTETGDLRSWTRYAQNWQHLLWQLLCIRHKQDCVRFVQGLGSQVGLLHGSLKHRVAPPAG
jgi:cellulose synthase/poly-beta-1,6-N-acetylglucosamine synthase-like glycosyltransferase